jgi:hypothetical protein
MDETMQYKMQSHERSIIKEDMQSEQDLRGTRVKMNENMECAK